MSSKKPRSQKIPFNPRKNMKINAFLTKMPKQEENDYSFSPVKVEPRKRPSDQERKLLPKKSRPDLAPPRNKTINITLGVNHKKHKNMKHRLIGKETESLYEALKTLDAVNEEIHSHQGKEMLVHGVEGIDGFIHLGMPLSCFPEDSRVVITFSKTGSEWKEANPVFEPCDLSSAHCVKFYIHAVGKRNVKILKCRELHKEGNRLCVYGFKGETIKDTLRKDGRFLPFVENDNWKLVTNLDTIIENTQPVDELEGKVFQVDTKKKKKTRPVAATAQNSDVEKNKSHELKEYIVNEYRTLKIVHEAIKAYIKAESEERKKTSLHNAHRTDFRKLTNNSTPVKVHKLLSQLSDSVGYLWWNNNGNKGCATCFVFSGLHVFTCRHVINDIVGKGIEASKWAAIISQCVKVIFDYEEFPPREESCFSIDPWFEISDETLDYAVLKLKLKENGQQVPMGLCNRIGTTPSSGLLHIIGHPNGDNKSTDDCAVVPLGEREKKYRERVEAEPGWSNPIYMHTKRSFPDNINNLNLVTYDTTFFGGSSGSPVFDSEGALVAMHTAGFNNVYQTGGSTIIEFGFTMEAIMADIKKKYQEWYDKECVGDVEMLSLEY